MSATTQSMIVYNKKFGEIVKSNKLVEAKYELTLLEQKLVLAAISKINPSKRKANIVSTTVKQFCNLIGTSQERYSEVREALRSLRKKEIILTSYDKENEIEEELISGWITTAHYKKGQIDITFPEELMPYLVELKEKYTVYNIENVVDLTSKHSIRMYELLKEHEYRSELKIEYEKLKTLICLGDKFDRYYDFKKRVIDTAKKELFLKTDICFDFKEERKGKTVVGLFFKISRNGTVLERRQREQSVAQQLEYYGEKDVMNVLEKYKSKTHSELSEELHTLIVDTYEMALDMEEIKAYSRETLRNVIFGIVDGKYKDVKKPKVYFRTVLRKEEEQINKKNIAEQL